MAWAIVAAAGIGLVSGVMQGNAQASQQQATAQNDQNTANLTTQRQAWLAEQQQKWAEEDTATARAQKSADIGVFDKYQSDPSKYTPSANLYEQQYQADSPNLANFDPTKLGAMSQLATPPATPVAAAPAPGGLQQ